MSMDVRIGEVHAEIEVTEGIGALGPEDVKRIVNLVLEHVRQEQARAEDRDRDTKVHNRVFNPDIRNA